MDIGAKLRPLYLLQILKERTDEDNYLTTSRLCNILKQSYGMETHRTTIKGDIEVLQKSWLQCRRTSLYTKPVPDVQYSP